MTKRIAIVNLSNWDGEDFEIEVKRKRRDGTEEKETVSIRPGEHADVCWGNDATVSVSDKEREEPSTVESVKTIRTHWDAVIAGYRWTDDGIKEAA